MTDTEKKSASSHEEYRGDSERGAHVNLNANVSARSVYSRCYPDRVLVPYSFPWVGSRTPYLGSRRPSS